MIFKRLIFFKSFILSSFMLFLAAGLVGCGFGENRPTPPDLKIQYTKNDQETIKCFKVIEEKYKSYEKGNLEPSDFVKAIDCTESLLLKGAAIIKGEQKDSFSPKEVNLILTSGILAESKKIELWVTRLIAITNIIYGSDQSRISIDQLKEVFRRIRLTAPMITKLSELQMSLKSLDGSVSPEHQAKYLQTNKDIILTSLKGAKVLFENEKGEIKESIVKQVILDQIKEMGLDSYEKSWDSYINAAYLMNKIIFGRSEKSIPASDVDAVLSLMDTVFQKMFDAYAIYQKGTWTSKDYVGVLKNSEEFMNAFLDAFYESGGAVIRSQDLSQLLDLLNVGLGGQSDTFIHALVDLKCQLFKNTDINFTRQDVSQLRTLLSSSIFDGDEVARQSETFSQRADFSKLNFLWKSPKEATSSTQIKVEDMQLSAILLHLIDHVIRIYDGNSDSKLSLSSTKGSKQELTSLVTTIQKMVSGFRALMGDSPMVTSVINQNAEVLGKVILGIADKLFINSNHDDMLDHFEILEMANFVVENDNLVSLLNAKGYTIDTLDQEPIFREYFPLLVQSFSNSEPFAFQHYLGSVMQMFGIDASKKMLSTDELKMVCGFLRLVESIFLKYDTDKNGSLSASEIMVMYPHFKSLIEEAYKYYESSGVASSLGWLDWLWDGVVFYTWLNYDDVYKRLLYYSLAFGELPSRLPSDPSTYSKESSRVEIIKLFKGRLKDLIVDSSSQPK